MKTSSFRSQSRKLASNQLVNYELLPSPILSWSTSLSTRPIASNLPLTLKHQFLQHRLTVHTLSTRSPQHHLAMMVPSNLALAKVPRTLLPSQMISIISKRSGVSRASRVKLVSQGSPPTHPSTSQFSPPFLNLETKLRPLINQKFESSVTAAKQPLILFLRKSLSMKRNLSKKRRKKEDLSRS